MRRSPGSLLFGLGLALVVAATANPVRAETFQFADVVGWWSAEPQYGGDSSRVVLHFLEDNGKQAVRISLLGIGGYEVPIGTVAIDGMTLDMKPYPFPLRFDPKAGTLSGVMAEEAVPVYKIPVEFHRIEPLAKPAPRTWDLPRPHVRWTFDTGAAVWAGIEHDAASGLIYVANDAGTLYALDAKGAKHWEFATGKPVKARPAVIGDCVYLASDSGFLYRLDKSSGAERWRAKIDTGSPELWLEHRRRQQARLRRQSRQDAVRVGSSHGQRAVARADPGPDDRHARALSRPGSVRRLQGHRAGGRRERWQAALEL
jgi:outer membrane protein assembly factor BamB